MRHLTYCDLTVNVSCKRINVMVFSSDLGPKIYVYPAGTTGTKCPMFKILQHRDRMEMVLHFAETGWGEVCGNGPSHDGWLVDLC